MITDNEFIKSSLCGAMAILKKIKKSRILILA